MRTPYEERISEAREIEGHLAAGGAKIVTRRFGPVAKLLWPYKTAAHLAAIGKSNERTAKRWLAGEFAPPTSVMLATINEIFGDQP